MKVFKDSKGKIYYKYGSSKWLTENDFGQFVEIYNKPDDAVTIEKDYDALFYVYLEPTGDFLDDRQLCYKKYFYIFDKDVNYFRGIWTGDKTKSYIEDLIPYYDENIFNFIKDFNPFKMKKEDIDLFYSLSSCYYRSALLAQKDVLKGLIDNAYSGLSEEYVHSFPEFVARYVVYNLDNSTFYNSKFRNSHNIVEKKLSFWERQISFTYLGKEYTLVFEIFPTSKRNFSTYLKSFSVC